MMSQLPLFPSPAANARPLPESVRTEVLERVGDLLLAVLRATSEEKQMKEGKSDE
jgi:hypothetical protein